jgi:serine protease AprX
MDTARRTATAIPTRGLLALALAAGTALSVLSPVAAAPSAPLVDVIVTSTGSGVAAAADAVRAAGGVVRDALPLVSGVSAELPAGAVLAPSFSVVPNSPLELASKEVATLKRDATPIRQALGLADAPFGGAGVRIAIVDTGVEPSAEFQGRLTPLPVNPSWTGDPYGHGTFVAGVAAGAGAADNRYAGVAPLAHVLDVRVAADDGSTDLTTVLKGLALAKAHGADVVNLSLSSGSNLPHHIDPLTLALDRLWADGIVVVVPTGNDGPSRASVTSPGSDPMLLTVGALDEKLTSTTEDDDVPAFSGRGPAPMGVAKPDLVAPGQSLVSVRAVGSVVDRENPHAVVQERYFRGSGTSFATAAVAGTAALMLKAQPTLTPDQVKAVVRGTAYSAKGLSDVRDAGKGGLDVAAALAAAAPDAPSAVVDAPPAGDEVAWRAFLEALLADDKKAAVAAWKQLSPEGHRWAANSWSGHRWGANSWSGHRWGGHRWADAEASADEWEMRFWAGHRWAGHRWADDEWVGHRWAGHRWAGHRWAGHRWAEEDWAGHRWAGHRWAEEDWSGHRWAGHRWAGHRWAAHGWAGSRWA